MNSSHVKIRFPLEQDESGYPPETSETMWAVPLGNGRYRLDNIPFYAKLVSDGDVVAASIIDGDLTFEEILEASGRSEEHTSELQSLMRNSYAVFCLKKKKNTRN